ncbi:hypothetical protein JOC70_001634 [Clostridium pascui]|nr:hypothetical protein [Clostridium pascui]
MKQTQTNHFDKIIYKNTHENQENINYTNKLNPGKYLGTEEPMYWG